MDLELELMLEVEYGKSSMAIMFFEEFSPMHFELMDISRVSNESVATSVGTA